MDAFAISIIISRRPSARCRYVMKITAVYAFFQFAMPGWVMVHEAAKALGIISFRLLLAFLGGRMILERR